VAHGVYAVIHN